MRSVDRAAARPSDQQVAEEPVGEHARWDPPSAEPRQRGGRDWVTLTREQIENDRLPDNCMACGAPTLDRVNKDFEHTPDWATLPVIVGLFCGFFPGLIILWLTTRRVRVACPICAKHRRAQRRLVWVASTGWLAMPLLGLIGFGLAYPFVGATSLAAVAAPAVGVVIGLVAYVVPVIRLCQFNVSVQWITRDYVRFRGVSAAFARGAAELAGIDQSDAASRGLGGVARPRPPSALRDAWDAWWSERDRWFATVALAVLLIAHLGCMSALLYLRGESGFQAGLAQGGGAQAQSYAATQRLGWPTPWFSYERASGDEGSSTNQSIRPLTWSMAIGGLGLFLYYAFWRVLQTNAYPKRPPGLLSPERVVGFWAIVAIAFALIARSACDRNFAQMETLAQQRAEASEPGDATPSAERDGAPANDEAQNAESDAGPPESQDETTGDGAD